MADIEYRVSGFKVTGTWRDVVEHGERITAALRRLNATDDEGFDEWNEWRPKRNEQLDEDISRKTAEKASVDEGPGEQAGEAPTDDLQRAGEKLEEAYEHLDEGEEVVDRAQDTLGYTTRALSTVSRKALRGFEQYIYENVMTAISPYYFDNELVSANLTDNRKRIADEREYTFEVNITDDELKEEVEKLLRDYEEHYDRGCIEAPTSDEAIIVIEEVEEVDEDESARAVAKH